MKLMNSFFKKILLINTVPDALKISIITSIAKVDNSNREVDLHPIFFRESSISSTNSMSER